MHAAVKLEDVGDSGDSRPGGRFQYGILMDPLMTVLSRVWRTWRKRATVFVISSLRALVVLWKKNLFLPGGMECLWLAIKWKRIHVVWSSFWQAVST